MAGQKEKVQNIERRKKNFDEVKLGFSKGVALEQARIFPQFSDPSLYPKCPLGIDIAKFIRELREGNVSGALDSIKEHNCLPGICGRVCYAPCEQEFLSREDRAPIGIRILERFAADNGKKMSLWKKVKKCTGPKVAVVGSGPSGLSAAEFLANRGFSVTVFESLPLPGGIFRYGIPEFRLPKKILDNELEELRFSGIQFVTNCPVGSAVSLQELFGKQFKAVVYAAGSGGIKFLKIPGTMLKGTYYAPELLLNVNLTTIEKFEKFSHIKLGNKIVVLGCDNAALDCARICVRLGKDVSVVFEQAQDGVSVRPDIIESAREEGMKGEGLMRPLEIIAGRENSAAGVKCVSLDFADPDSSGQWQLVPVPKSEFVLDADTVIMSGGYAGRHICSADSKIRLKSNGSVWVDPKTNMTSLDGVFASGDAVEESVNIVNAMASGKKAAESVIKYLS